MRQMRGLFLLVLSAGIGLWPVPTTTAAQGLPAEQPEALGLSRAGLQQVAAVVQTHIDSGLIAGAVLVVARQSKVAYFEPFGVMDLETRRPMRKDALFRVCSMTKPVTAVATMQLADRGRLKLEDPVAKYIPAFAQVSVYAGGPSTNPQLRPPDRPILVEDLLLHTSGFTYGPWGTLPVDTLWTEARLFNWNRPVAEFADKVARLPLLFSPGSAWNYGVSFEVLGRVIEVASGKPLDVYLQDEIFGPLQMSDTSFFISSDARDRVPTLYDRGGPDGRLRPTGQHIGECGDYRPGSRLIAGGAGLVSTPADYLRFAQMLLNYGQLDGRRVLSDSSTRRLLSNHLPAKLLPLPLPSALGKAGQAGYGQGYGGAVLVDPAVNSIPGPVGIYRWLGYYSTYFWVDPANNLIAMVWTQYLPGAGTTLGLEPAVQRALYAAVLSR